MNSKGPLLIWMCLSDLTAVIQPALANLLCHSYRHPPWRASPLSHRKNAIAPGMRRKMIKERTSGCFREQSASKVFQQHQTTLLAGTEEKPSGQLLVVAWDKLRFLQMLWCYEIALFQMIVQHQLKSMTFNFTQKKWYLLQLNVKK